MESIITTATRYQYLVKEDVILASWEHELSVESEEFLYSLKDLFQLAQERNLRKILIDSGTPDGGVLTEEAMLLIQQAVVKMEVDKIALLETLDFHWDNNLLQFFQYLQSSRQICFELKLFNDKQKALEWLGA